jgi:tetratricopeptide (TPR) repeat protein
VTKFSFPSKEAEIPLASGNLAVESEYGIMNPKELELRYGKAIAAHQAGRIAEAEMLYAQILKLVPDADAVNTNMAALQYGKGNFTSALGHVTKSLKVNPVNVDALVNRATILLALGRKDEALEAYMAVIKVNDRNPLSYYNLANLLFENGENENAEAAFRKAIDLKPDFFQASYNLGNVLVQLRRHAEAQVAYERTLILSPTHEGAHLNLSNIYAAMGLYDKAFLQINLGLELLPQSWAILCLKSKLENEIGMDAEALASADKALQLNRDSVNAWIHRGNALRCLERMDEASESYQMALAIEPGHMGALRNLRRVSAAGIPSWHFHMLADTARNAAFDVAIRKAVQTGDLVLDIGTGSGLLAMMAARAGASKVIACESSENIANAAKDIVAQNGYSERIEVFGLHSGLLKVGKQLPAKADVIVTEILDAALLGEGMLPSIWSALQTLAKPDAIVVPAAAVICVQLVQLPDILSQGTLGNIEGFNLQEFERFRIPQEYEVIHLRAHPDAGKSEILKIKHLNFTELGPAIEEERPERFSVEFSKLKNGQANALALWFDLQLDAEIQLSSGPNGELRHWGQAVFFFDAPVELVEGETLQVEGAFSDTMWQFWLP